LKAGIIDHWYYAHLACMWSWIWYPALKKKKKLTSLSSTFKEK
jgi:hypothetical protein